MKILQILEKYDTVLLDQISSDKIDEAISLRLPQSVIVQEITSALSSQSYIANRITYAKPPTFAILNLLLQSPNYMMEVEGFRAKVLDYVTELSNRTGSQKLSAEKNHQLYIKILKRAWESDGVIDKSEGYILELVKSELGIWDKEHYALTHDPSILSLWDIDQEYYTARNYLLATGIILTDDSKYVIAEEVAVQIRKAFGIEIMDDSYARLLHAMNKEDITFALEQFGLPVSGSKDDIVIRLIKALIPPGDILALYHLENLRELCRRENIQIGGPKNAVIINIIHHFDTDLDLETETSEEPMEMLPTQPESREMEPDHYIKVLQNLTNQQLYDILFQAYLATSGSKDEKIRRVVDSPWAERSIFNNLRKEDLAQLCRKFSLQVSGSKQELVDRVLDYNPTNIIIEQPVETIIEPQAAPIASTPVAGPSPVNMEPAPLPSAWEEVSSQFPYLQEDEKIVLAILKETKSLTELELERVVVKHKLNWFLHKANMAEMMAKLKRNNKHLIRIKSIQNANIYQWTANENADETIIEKRAARDIIDALRHGVVPKSNLSLLMVGQQTARNHLSEMLNEINHNKSHFKFIRGQYGSGKTFLCSWLKEYALDNEFAVSFLNISHDQPLSDLPIFFSGLVNGLRTPEKTDSSALVDILESWLLNIHTKVAQIEGMSSSSSTSNANLSATVQKSIESELSNLNDIEPGFSQALRAFYRGKVEGDQMLVSNAVAWITGSRSLSSQALRDIGVKGYLEANNVFPRMRAILEIISGARYKGLLLLVDELELVRKFPHARQREQALETLRLLIDEAGRNALPACLVIFTGTDEFFEDERYGLKSYEALAERVLTPLVHESFVSMRQPIISLESLDKERLSHVVLKIRDLYGTAYSWDARQFAGDDSISKLIDEWTLFGDESIDRKPRPILREFIQMLDLCEENKGVNLSQFLKKPIERLIDQPISSN